MKPVSTPASAPAPAARPGGGAPQADAPSDGDGFAALVASLGMPPEDEEPAAEGVPTTAAPPGAEAANANPPVPQDPAAPAWQALLQGAAGMPALAAPPSEEAGGGGDIGAGEGSPAPLVPQDATAGGTQRTAAWGWAGAQAAAGPGAGQGAGHGAGRRAASLLADASPAHGSRPEPPGAPAERAGPAVDLSWLPPGLALQAMGSGEAGAAAAASRTGTAPAHGRQALDGLGELAAQGLHGLSSASPSPMPERLEATLASRPGERAFAAELASQVEVMLEGEITQARLQLNPAELGPIRILLTVQAQTADIQFLAAHEGTREGIRQGIDELRQMLAGQGLSLGQADVGTGQGRDGAFAQPGEGAARRTGEPAAARPAALPEATVAGARFAAARGLGRLDLYA